MNDLLKNISKGAKKKDLYGNDKQQDQPAEKQNGSSFFEGLRKSLQYGARDKANKAPREEYLDKEKIKKFNLKRKSE